MNSCKKGKKKKKKNITATIHNGDNSFSFALIVLYGISIFLGYLKPDPVFICDLPTASLLATLLNEPKQLFSHS